MEFFFSISGVMGTILLTSLFSYQSRLQSQLPHFQGHLQAFFHPIYIYPVFCNAHLVGSFDPTSLPRPCFLPRLPAEQEVYARKRWGGFVCDFCELGGRRLVVNMMDTKCKKYIYNYIVISYDYIFIYTYLLFLIEQIHSQYTYIISVCYLTDLSQSFRLVHADCQ